MTSAPALEPAVDPITRARLRNERFIARLSLATTFAGFTVIVWRIATIESEAGVRMLLFVGVATVICAYGLFDPTPLRPWKLWLRSTFEMSATSVLLMIDLQAGTPFLVTSSTAYVYVLAAAVSCLRLKPALSLYVAALGIAQQAAIYLYALHGVEQLTLGESVVPVARYYQELYFRLTVLALVGALGFTLARTLAREIAAAAQESVVRAAFGSYVDARVVARVLQGDLTVKPERRMVTVLFVDIRDFTRFSETRDPEQVFAMLTEALDVFATAVQKQGGIVNKFLGDGLMALFGAPEPQADHARRAVRAALSIAEEARLRSVSQFPGLRVGIGVHTGEVVVGDLGGARREYTAIGDVVNVASRVEAANKELGTTILITEDVRLLLGSGAQLQPQPPLPLRGRTGTIPLYEVVDMSGTSEHVLQPRPATRSGA